MPRKNRPDERHRHTRLHVRQQAARHAHKRDQRLMSGEMRYRFERSIDLSQIDQEHGSPQHRYLHRAMAALPRVHRRRLSELAERCEHSVIQLDAVGRDLVGAAILTHLLPWHSSTWFSLDQRLSYDRLGYEPEYDIPDMIGSFRSARKRVWRHEEITPFADWQPEDAIAARREGSRTQLLHRFAGGLARG